MIVSITESDLAGGERFELSKCGFGDRCFAVRLSPYLFFTIITQKTKKSNPKTNKKY